MTDEAFDMRTIEGCIGWGLFRDKPKRAQLSAELAQLRQIAVAAQALADRLPPNGAATPHTPVVLGEYGTTLLYTLREALVGVGDE